MINNAKFHHQSFFDLLNDSLFQHRLSKNSSGFASHCHARASITSSLLLIECAANSLIQELELNKHLQEPYDKLQPLAKIDTFLKLSGLHELERSCIEVQRISELLKARNDFVHPKTTIFKTEIDKLVEQTENYELPFKVTTEVWTGIKITKAAMFWSSEDSYKVLSAIRDFLAYLFLKLMQLDSQEIYLILVSSVSAIRSSDGSSADQVVIPLLFEEIKNEINLAKGADLDFCFIKP